jgi:hypothetical protein
MMSASQFAEIQYNSLRKEIEKSKENMLKFIVGGSAVVPAAQYLGDKFSIGAITLALPIVVVVMVLLFLAENHAMMRAGTYILTEIEPHVDGIRGWETWLSSRASDNGARTVDKLVVISFALVSASYFIVSIVLAARYAAEAFGSGGQYLVTGIYVSVGFGLTTILYKQARTDTQNS